jgi:hypothetical protein
MIYKEIDIKNNMNKLVKAGEKAESQMAFYLKRAFGDDDKIYVLNDLRIKVDDEIAQIDHLVIHSYGFIIIESKSVTTQVSINEYDEWSRVYNNDKKGMPSPIKQAERQIEILKKLLNNHASEIFNEGFFNKYISKPTYSKFHFDILVAISDDGIIERTNKKQSEDIVKSEQITDKIKKLKKQYFMQNINPLLMLPHQELSIGLIARTADFLKLQHQSVNESRVEIKAEKLKEIILPKKEIPLPDKVMKPSTTPICSKCQSPNIEIQYGKYGYYFKCLSCDGNTVIKLKCKDSKCKPKLTKKKLVFTQVCDICGDKKHFFTNKINETSIVS